MIVEQITVDGITENHAEGSDGNSTTLCSLEVTGDEEIGISESIRIQGKITCTTCISIIDYCKTIKEKDIDRKRK